MGEIEDIDDLVLVYGSDLSGTHEKGLPQWAARFRGASDGVAEGRTGQAYAIPTKDEHGRALPMTRIRSGLWRFAAEVSSTPGVFYQMTKIGCGPARIQEAKILALIDEAGLPDRVHLPGTWNTRIHPERMRVAVVVDLIHRNDRQIRADLDALLRYAGKTQRQMEVVTPDTAPMDRAVVDWAETQGVALRIVQTHYLKYAGAAEQVRTVTMLWYATHLLAYPVGQAREVLRTAHLARAMGVITTVRDTIDTPAAWARQAV